VTQNRVEIEVGSFRVEDTPNTNDPDDYQLHPRITSQIFQRFGTPTIDLFASSRNKQAGKYFSKNPEPNQPGWKGQNALDHSWDRATIGDSPYANPPWKLIPLLVEKVKKDKVSRLILVSPSMTDEIKEMAIAPPIVIRHDRDTYIAQGKPELKGIGMPRWPCSFAVLISGKEREAPTLIPAVNDRLKKMKIDVKVQEGSGPTARTKALIDSGAQANIISSSLESVHCLSRISNQASSSRWILSMDQKPRSLTCQERHL
jgi:hypothetical protein